jgi:predicted enzyme related to lactoylglutathione lyase
MHRAKSIQMVWISVKDLKKAVKFYTEVAGLSLKEMNEEWGWAELEGHEGEGMRLGIGQENPDYQGPIKPGQNAVVTFTVDNLEEAIHNMQKQGAVLIGEIEVVPDHVKLQAVRDTDGNLFQLVEEITAENCSTQDNKHSCCCH